VVKLSPVGRLEGISKFVLQKFPMSINKLKLHKCISPILRQIQRDIIISFLGHLVKYPLFLSDFKET